MSEPLARVIDPGALELLRGPDAHHRIVVPREWLDEGARVEIELPRTLSCAACAGGGCDACGRSGAVVTRGRGEPAELVTVQLPPQHEGAVVRIAFAGGLPLTTDEDIPRGHLLLRVRAGDVLTEGVVKLALDLVEIPLSNRRASLVPIPPGLAPRTVIAVVIVVMIVIAIVTSQRC